jgi:hypothetical protein
MEGRADSANHRGHVALDDPGVESESAYAEGGETCITSGVVGGMSGVGSAVDLDGEGAGGGKEVDNEAVEGDLPSEADAEGGIA